MRDSVPIQRALISVSDKTGVVALAQALQRLGVEILSTGGTAAYLQAENISLIDVSDYTGFPEIMEGRVKTLQPKIHGGILAKRHHPEHQAAMREHDIPPIDLVVVNLYPFETALTQALEADLMIEQIDIGGPAMIRAAAKNATDVVVVVDPADYQSLIDALGADASTPYSLRRQLAAKAFARTAAYDAMIARWFVDSTAEPGWPDYFADARKAQELRYGENPHQSAAVYRGLNHQGTVLGARQLQGKALSYNNINDTDAAWRLVCEWQSPAVAIIKHANPSGVAVADSAKEAFTKALACDPVSAFGGILAVNQPVDTALVEAIGSLFLEVIIAPAIEQQAAELLALKKNLRVLITDGLPKAEIAGWAVKSVSGGYLLQQSDAITYEESQLQQASNRAPSTAEYEDLLFAFMVCKHVKSNAIVLAKNGTTIGIGAGQMSRIDSVRLACEKAAAAGFSTAGAVLASDAFFPFDDNVHHAAKAGITALIQPGGSVRDAEVIQAADQHGMAMLLTGIRHFNH